MASDTLIIKKLPYNLSNEDKISFLKECGAISVNIIGACGKKNNIAFARFHSEIHAKQALYHLHQQEVLGSFLVVEYARIKTNLANQSVKEFKTAKIKETGTEALLKKFFDKLNNWTAGVDFRAPIPNHLNYHYPPPTPATLNNISNQLALSTKFYTQVLHLMNKLNLPCPFINETHFTPPKPCDNIISDAQGDEVPSVTSTESESEISSEEEKIKETIPQLKPKAKKVIKRPRITKQINPTFSKTKKQKIDEVFDDPRLLIDKKEKSKTLPLETEKNLSESVENLGFGFIHPKNKPKEPEPDLSVVDVRNVMEEERLEKEIIHSISLEELKNNRISEKDRSLLPVFKNYAEGAPTCRLYVKNLSKQTSEEHLKFIYSRFIVENLDGTPDTFDIRLMQEGRMKGQAFITLQTVESAKEALRETNGYILNDKPMVVQFARSAVK